jgi:hypothetical protein
MDAGREIRMLTRALGLKDERQDWGIINSDPTRVEEFIRFRETSDLTPAQQYAVGELVFASMNDALEEEVADDKLIDLFERFLSSGLQGMPAHVRYWSSLDEEEFPIVTLLHRLEANA